ncbi:MAG: LptF/LptG family permease [Bacteroidetes bacterium]|nr:LptF/LptG family permease [Bacteroidota bacterium]
MKGRFIKKLDILILRSFIGPFIVTFFITLFVLVMQFFWLYMDELIGKGLGTWMIVQLLFYMSTTMVPLALPLGILLASIMTFGNMGENFELVAIKSAGISLLRFMRPLLVFITLIGAFAFFFNNNVIPYANLKALSLLYDLRNSKPAFNIRAGQFNNGIQDFAIRVGEKDKDGRTIRNIIIYDHTNGGMNDKVVIAKEGEMIPTPDKHYMIFRLKDGWRYEEASNNNQQGSNYQQMRMNFKRWDKVFDLSSFKVSRTNEELFKDAYQMMDVVQLNERIDSFKRYEKHLSDNIGIYLGPNISVMANTHDKDTIYKLAKAAKAERGAYTTGFIETIPDSMKNQAIVQALNYVRNSKGLLDISSNDRSIQHSNFLQFNIEWHRKFTLSFACVLLFLIGAPLGAIIRKGGLGMPLVIAVAFFVVFHIMSITGEKLSRTGALPPWAGMWMATSMLLPIAFVLINQARNDSQIFSKEWYQRIWSKIISPLKRKQLEA